MRTGFSLAFCVVLVGCSGAASSDLFATAGEDSTSPAAASTNAPAASSTAPASSSPSSNGSSGASGSGGSGNNGSSGNGNGSGNSGDSNEAGSTSGKDAGSGSANAACAPADTEVEPNDTVANANVISGSKFCGEINPPTDVDFATFTLSATAKNVSVDYTATDKISIQVTTKGTTIEITGTNPPPIPTNPGDKYYIEVKGVSGSMPAYVITVTQ